VNFFDNFRKKRDWTKPDSEKFLFVHKKQKKESGREKVLISKKSKVAANNFN